jgi:tyrosinase
MGQVIRKDIDTYSAVELAALRKGYAQMQALSDNRGFNYISGYHGIPNFYCYHLDDPALFLPWHRAYLLEFEHLLRDRDAALSVPYWNWASATSHAGGVPKAFSDKLAADRSANPLYDSEIKVPASTPPIHRRTQRFPGQPQELPPATAIDALVREPSFVRFSRRLRDVHNHIHGWTGGMNAAGTVGGDMGAVATAAFDPIFYSHHCMIDRTWNRWQQLHGINNIPGAILHTALKGFNLTVSDVLDTTHLGYSYATASVVVKEKT